MHMTNNLFSYFWQCWAIIITNKHSILCRAVALYWCSHSTALRCSIDFDDVWWLNLQSWGLGLPPVWLADWHVRLNLFLVVKSSAFPVNEPITAPWPVSELCARPCLDHPMSYDTYKGKRPSLSIYLFINLFIYLFKGGSVAEWLGRRTWNPEVTGSSPALTT